MDTSREKFDAALAELFAVLDKPFNQVKADAFWRGLQTMSFVQFCRARDQVVRELQESEPPRTFTPHSLWAALKRLRAHGPSEPPKESDWLGDGWDIQANLRLLSYIRNQGAVGVYYASAELTAPLVAFKNAWARDCREEVSTPTRETQERWWRECMARAEEQIAVTRAGTQAAA